MFKRFQKHSQAVVSIVNAQTSAEAIPYSVRDIGEQPPSTRPPKSSPARRAIQKKRVDDMRRDTSAIIDAELSRALREKLLFGS